MTSSITPLQPLWDTMPLTRASKIVEGPTGGGESFTNIFQTAIDGVRETDQEATHLEYLLSTGQLDNPAELSLALYKASTAVDLLVNLRNKAVDAYNEIMRISL